MEQAVKIAQKRSLIDILLTVAVVVSVILAGYFTLRPKATTGQTPLSSRYTPLLLHQLSIEEMPTYAQLEEIAQPTNLPEPEATTATSNSTNPSTQMHTTQGLSLNSTRAQLTPLQQMLQRIFSR